MADEKTEGAGMQAAFDKAIEGLDLEDEAFEGAAETPATEAEPEPEGTEEQQAEAKPQPQAKPVAKSPAKAKGKDGAAKATSEAPAVAEAQAPANWDAKRKETFGKLPSEAKALVLDMTKAAEADFAKQKPLIDYGRAISSLVTDQHRHQMSAGGFKNEVEGLAHLVRLNDWAASSFPEYSRWAFQQFAGNRPIADVLRQVFPEAFTGTAQPQDGATQPQPQPPADPRVNQVYDTLRTIASKVDGIEQGNRTQQLRSADQVISRFRDDKDDTGNLRHPHFAAVEGNMTRLLKTPDFLEIEDMGERLSRAYEAAVALDPTIRQQFLDGEVARQLEAKRKAEDVARAKRARAPISAPPAGPAKTGPRGLDAAVNHAMSLVGG